VKGRDEEETESRCTDDQRRTRKDLLIKRLEGENQSYRADVKRIRRSEEEKEERNCVRDDFIKETGKGEEGQKVIV